MLIRHIAARLQLLDIGSGRALGRDLRIRRARHIDGRALRREDFLQRECHAQRHALLRHARRADGPGVVAAVARVNRDGMSGEARDGGDAGIRAAFRRWLLARRIGSRFLRRLLCVLRRLLLLRFRRDRFCLGWLRLRCLGLRLRRLLRLRLRLRRLRFRLRRGWLSRRLDIRQRDCRAGAVRPHPAEIEHHAPGNRAAREREHLVIVLADRCLHDHAHRPLIELRHARPRHERAAHGKLPLCLRGEPGILDINDDAARILEYHRPVCDRRLGIDDDARLVLRAAHAHACDLRQSLHALAERRRLRRKGHPEQREHRQEQQAHLSHPKTSHRIETIPPQAAGELRIISHIFYYRRFNQKNQEGAARRPPRKSACRRCAPDMKNPPQNYLQGIDFPWQRGWEASGIIPPSQGRPRPCRSRAPCRSA